MTTQPGLFDITANYHKGNQNSVAANKVTNKERDRDHILTVLKVGPMTCDEIEQATGLCHQTASARWTDLKKLGAIIRTGERRKTRRGCNADVFRIKETQ